MKNTVMLNSEKINYDRKLNFTPLLELTALTTYDTSTNHELLERAKDQNILITKELPVGRDLITKLPPSVKLICEAGTGYNNIDIVAAREKNITVCNVPGYSTEAVAQLAITYMLCFCSSMTQQQVMIKQKNYTNFTKFLQLPHFEIQNKTLGVIGAGAIGRQLINIAVALGMNVLVYTRTPNVWGNPNVRTVRLNELLQQSDFVSIHCPLTAETTHMINKEKLKLMKPSSYIINTSRGPILDEVDLIAALQNKTIAGAALDVQDPEPPELHNPLFNMENVILTPHIGWQTIESRQRLIKLLAVNIESFIQGRPVNVVN